ncbi:protein SSUH2 homolog isoform X1 [Amphiura filiformis]|uniref:protein SSUH2 homolog isoform X1 n=1 Tax=Amphiura filiformis TaxID=82378 RepID=UPI003B20C614
MNINTDYPTVGQQAYPGGEPTSSSVPVPQNQPDLAPPPCPAYPGFNQPGYDSGRVAAEGVQVQFVSQPTAPQADQEVWQRQSASGNQWDDTPDALVDENDPEGQDDGPSSPTENFEPIPGYERHSTVAYDTVFDIPPPAYEPPSEDSRPTESFSAPDFLTEKVVRDALLTFVDQECCYGSKPARQMNINTVEHSSGLHYQLESFTEARHTKWAYSIYRSGPVDGPHYGRAPLPWEINCQPTKLFSDHQKELEVPHTSVVKNCFKCNGSGKLTCGKCKGKGKVRCGRCWGSGHTSSTDGQGHSTSQRCTRCRGKGKVKCSRCDATGQVTCHICDGTGKLRHFLKLLVKFTNHLSDYVLEETDMPAELIKDVSGQVIFEQTLPYVWPITQYPVQPINDNSIRIVNAHIEAWPKERTLMQRQVLRSVPVSEVAYTWKNVNTRFWVYGFEHKVHAPDYPHQCCWGCNVL